MDEKQPVAAVRYIDDTPHFELSAPELTVRIGASDSERFFFAHLRPYTPAEIKQALRGLKTGVRDAGTLIVQEDADSASVRELCDEVLLRLSHIRLPDGSDPTPEQQRAWLSRNARLKKRIVNEAFATVVMLGSNALESTGEDVGDDVFEISLEDSGASVRYIYLMFSDDRQCPETIAITHQFETETEADFDAFDRASRKQTEKRTGTTTIDTDYDALEKLYNRTILRVDGVLLNGEPLSSHNREKWIPKIPFWHKLIALNARFDDVSKKNNA